MLISAEIRSAFHQDRQLERKVTDVQPQRDQHTGEVFPFRFTPGCLIALSSTYRRSLSFVHPRYRSLCTFLWYSSRIQRRTESKMSLVAILSRSLKTPSMSPECHLTVLDFFVSLELREICRLRFLLCPFAPSPLIQFDVAITLIEVPHSPTLSSHWWRNFGRLRNDWTNIEDVLLRRKYYLKVKWQRPILFLRIEWTH